LDSSDGEENTNAREMKQIHDNEAKIQQLREALNSKDQEFENT